MKNHDFIFNCGIWLGEGKITLQGSAEVLAFFTKWEIKEHTKDLMIATQIVEMQGIDNRMINSFTFQDILFENFSVILKNSDVGSVLGKGVKDNNTIRWQFYNQSNFEGFEVYERQENGNYFLHAEYGENGPYQTTIDGLIWKKSS